MSVEFTKEQFLRGLVHVLNQDREGLEAAREHYGDSWRAEGGFSAWFNVKRKIDRLVTLMNRTNPPGGQRFDMFGIIEAEAKSHEEATLDAVRDLRRYCALVESFLVTTGVELPLSRDNQWAEERRVADAIGKDVVELEYSGRPIQGRYIGLTNPRDDYRAVALRAERNKTVVNPNDHEAPFGFDVRWDVA